MPGIWSEWARIVVPSATSPEPTIEPLDRTPAIGSVARPLQSSTPCGKPDGTQDPCGRHQRQTQPELRASIRDPVDAHGSQQEAGHGGRGGERPGRAGRVAATAIAPRVHRRRQLQGAVECALENRDGDAAQTPKTTRRNAPHAPGLAHRADRLDQLGREGERNRDRHARFIEDGGQAAEQPIGTDQRVGGTETDQDHGDLQAENGGGDNRLQGDGAADAHRRRPGRKRNVGHGEQHVPGNAALAEEDLDDDPDDDHDGADSKKERQRPGPGIVARGSWRRRSTRPLRAGAGGTGSDWSSAWQTRPGTPPTPTRPEDAPGGSGADGSFLGRSASPPEPRDASEHENDDGHDDDRQRRVTTTLTVCGRIGLRQLGRARRGLLVRLSSERGGAARRRAGARGRRTAKPVRPPMQSAVVVVSPCVR